MISCRHSGHVIILCLKMGRELYSIIPLGKEKFFILVVLYELGEEKKI